MSVAKLAIVGPTASGKTALAVRVARLLGDAELVSLDAMAVYRGLDIGTAKPTNVERAGLLWHLTDLVEPYEEFTVAEFQAAFWRVRTEIASRGHRQIYVGGTGLYHRAAVDGLELGGRFEEIAAELADKAETPGGPAALYAELSAADPLAASRMNPANIRRIVRALEVVRGTGRPFSSFGEGLGSYPSSEVVTIGLHLSRPVLSKRISARLAAQLDAGLLAEVEALRTMYGRLSKTASQALGYRELFSHLDGEISLEEAIALIEARIRRFAKRQEAWFRRDPRVTWFEADEANLDQRIVERVRSGLFDPQSSGASATP